MKGLAIFMASIATAGAVGFVAYESEGFKNWNTATWFGGNTSTEQIQTEPDKTPEIKDNSLVVTPDANMSVRKLERSTYAKNGISEDTYGAYTLSVIVSPDHAYVKTATWSAAWKNPESTWASDKNVSDYITMNVSSGASTTVSCNAEFGEQIIVTAVSDGNTELSATCTLDFRKRAIDLKIYEHAGGMGYLLPEVYTATYNNSYGFLGEHKYGIGSVSADPIHEGAGISFSLSDEFITALQSHNANIVTNSPSISANSTTKLYNITLNSSFINSLAKLASTSGNEGNVPQSPFELCSQSYFWECVQSVEKHITLTYYYKYNGDFESSCVRYLKINVPPTDMSLSDTSIIF